MPAVVRYGAVLSRNTCFCRELQLPTLRQWSGSPATTHRKSAEPRRRPRVPSAAAEVAPGPIGGEGACSSLHFAELANNVMLVQKHCAGLRRMPEMRRRISPVEISSAGISPGEGARASGIRRCVTLLAAISSREWSAGEPSAAVARRIGIVWHWVGRPAESAASQAGGRGAADEHQNSRAD